MQTKSGTASPEDREMKPWLRGLLSSCRKLPSDLLAEWASQLSPRPRLLRAWSSGQVRNSRKCNPLECVEIIATKTRTAQVVFARPLVALKVPNIPGDDGCNRSFRRWQYPTTRQSNHQEATVLRSFPAESAPGTNFRSSTT